MQKVVSLLLVLLLFGSCYQQESLTPDAWDLTDRQLDSISFSTTHHYAQNYNFYVKADSLCLLVQQPAEVSDPLLLDTLEIGRAHV